MQTILLRRLLVLGALAVLAVPASAAADQVFHTLHADLVPVGGAPLQSGFVNDVHTNGVVYSAHERYQLNGALPSTTFQVTIHLYPFDPTCSTAPVVFPTTTLTTNGNGNGEAQFDFLASPTPPALVGPTHGILWELSVGPTVVYHTACYPLKLD